MKLLIFKDLEKDPVIKSFDDYMQKPTIENYEEFLSLLFKTTTDFGQYLLDKVFESSNLFLTQYMTKKNVDKVLGQALIKDLKQFNIMASYPFAGETIQPSRTPLNFVSEYETFLNNLWTLGKGEFRKYSTFVFNSEKNLQGVDSNESLKTNEFIGYKEQRETIIDNTVRFIENKEINNILLYGDAGTGKSSTIRALANQYFNKGLRLVEIRKEQLGQFPLLLNLLIDNPLKFIIFIDDLSFDEDDPSFVTAKNILEGSVSTLPSNVVLYATSNRRHLIRQSKGRRADEISENESVQENTSLSARFGLQIPFQKPDRELFFKIVRELYIKQNWIQNLESDVENELYRQADIFAQRMGSRSPRVAVQFVKTLS